MILEDIFKNDPLLLENQSVKDLIAFAQQQHEKNFNIIKRFDEKENKMLELFMYSEIILKNGRSSKETLKLIGDILNQ